MSSKLLFVRMFLVDSIINKITLMSIKSSQSIKLNINILNVAQEAGRQAKQMLFTTFMAIPQVAQNPAAVRELAQMYWDTFGLEGFDKVFPKQVAQQPMGPMQGVPNVEMMANPENAIRMMGRQNMIESGQRRQ